MRHRGDDVYACDSQERRPRVEMKGQSAVDLHRRPLLPFLALRDDSWWDVVHPGGGVYGVVEWDYEGQGGEEGFCVEESGGV